MGIGTDNFDGGDFGLYVRDGIKTEEIFVELCVSGGWCDYVFYDNYPLMPLKEVASFIEENKHLPNVPSAGELEGNRGFRLKKNHHPAGKN